MTILGYNQENENDDAQKLGDAMTIYNNSRRQQGSAENAGQWERDAWERKCLKSGWMQL